VRLMFSKHIRLLSILLLVTGVVAAEIIYISSASTTSPNIKQGRRVPLTVLQSSEPVIGSDYGKKPLLAPSKDGQSIYSLDSMTGSLAVFERNGKSLRKVADSFLNVEAFAVGPQNDLYLAQSDSTVQIVGANGRRLNAFRTVYPRSIAVLGNGNVVVASPFNGKTLHLYNGQGLLLASFGELKTFDNDQRENEFLNEGRVVVGPRDEIYYVSIYAPRPYVARFSSSGQLLAEFLIEGDAVDLQTGFTTDFLNRRSFCVGGVSIITSATINPDTGHLWLAMNGLSTQGTVYEYDQTGTKIREYAFLLNSKNRKHNVTHVKDIAVSGDSLSILTWGGTYAFKVSDPLIADAWKVPVKSAQIIKPTWTAWANPFARIFKSAPPPILRPGIPQPPDPPCEGQPYPCTASCPQNTSPNPADCGAQMAGFFQSNSTKRVTTNNCTARAVDSTPGSSAPGGCDQTVNWCDTAEPFATGSTTVHVNCTAVPTPTPTPEPTPVPTPVGGGESSCEFVGCAHGYFSFSLCCCTDDGNSCYGTPVLIDIAGDGFALTDAAGGVNFDLDNNGIAERLAWTAPNSDDGWLVLDRNGNGLIDNGGELFGNYTPQPAPPTGQTANGFLALAEYDKPTNGGNGDGRINWHDAFFNSLRVWQDANHNGFSEPGELQGLLSLKVAEIDLDYKESKRRDEHGNWFGYRAKVMDTRGAHVGRWAWDVFLLSRP
jgi:hypothetical protein